MNEIIENLRKIAVFNQRFAGVLDGVRFRRSLAELEASQRRVEEEIKKLREVIKRRVARGNGQAAQ